MRFVGVKTTEQQSVAMLHRRRELLVRQRSMLVNAIRAHMAEFGIVARTGLPHVKKRQCLSLSQWLRNRARRFSGGLN